MSVVTLSLFRFPSLPARLWVLGQMALAPRALRQDTRCQFFKLCGSGTGEGFTPRPNWQVWSILASWPDAETAQAAILDNPVYTKWAARAREQFSLFLSPTSVRGLWSGEQPFALAAPPQAFAATGPIAILTRATLRPRHSLRFWKRVPKISEAIGRDPNVSFKIGIGEVPFLHQVTFSVWPDVASMSAFAHRDGPHAQAIRAVRAGDWFSEELYARFHVFGTSGHWSGADRAKWPKAMEKDAA
ncbi:MAG TPA: spheroidene monooxygenase [Rhodobacteraceae bacterium]|nr:spheroidene monooxygenase [Paracoccaceae bacterium]